MLENDDNIMTLSKKIGVTFQAVSLWLNNKREPHISHVCSIAYIYNLDIEYLLGIKDENIV